MFDASYSFNESVRFSICAKKSANLLHFRENCLQKYRENSPYFAKINNVDFFPSVLYKKGKTFQQHVKHRDHFGENIRRHDILSDLDKIFVLAIIDAKICVRRASAPGSLKVVLFFKI
jgi:hypothetical protein